MDFSDVGTMTVPPHQLKPANHNRRRDSSIQDVRQNNNVSRPAGSTLERIRVELETGLTFSVRCPLISFDSMALDNNSRIYFQTGKKS